MTNGYKKLCSTANTENILQIQKRQCYGALHVCMPRLRQNEMPTMYFWTLKINTWPVFRQPVLMTDWLTIIH